jgi:hypothetical protein
MLGNLVLIGGRPVLATHGIRNCTRWTPLRYGFRLSMMCMLPPMSLKLVEFLFPWRKECRSQCCPTEEDWCRTDPECSESSYQEPDTSVNSGAIAGFTVAGIVLLIAALLYSLHVMKVKGSRNGGSSQGKARN